MGTVSLWIHLYQNIVSVSTKSRLEANSCRVKTSWHHVEYKYDTINEWKLQLAYNVIHWHLASIWASFSSFPNCSQLLPQLTIHTTATHQVVTQSCLEMPTHTELTPIAQPPSTDTVGWNIKSMPLGEYFLCRWVGCLFCDRKINTTFFL